jgi:hypothetical protein
MPETLGQSVPLTPSRFKLLVLPVKLAVCRLSPLATIPEWAGFSGLLAFIRTDDELCVVCREGDLPAEVTAEAGWRALQVQGPLDFSQVGVLAALSTVLAEANISLFALSTYDTDYLLVKDAHLERAVEALSRAGHQVGQWAGDPQ